jgi:tetratricopeptide (TPR) repeat protein
MALFDRSARANPSCGFAWAYSSLTYAYQGQTDEAARRFERAQAIMIHDPFSSFIEGFNAVIRYFEGEWEETIAICRRQLELRPSFTNIRKLLIGALCFAGRRHEARAEAAELQQVEPGFSWQRHLDTYPFGRSSDRAALRAALLRAGFNLEEADLRADIAEDCDLTLVASRQISGLHPRETLQ